MIEVALHVFAPLQRSAALVAHDSARCLHAVLGSVLGVAAGTLPLARSAHGKPYLAMAAAPAFSLSHSGAWLVVAVCSDPRVAAIGVDVEHDRGQHRSFTRLARRFFTPAEQALLQGLEPPVLAREFYRLWTLKEAWVKAHGLTLAPSLGAVCFANASSTTAVVSGEHSAFEPGRFARCSLAPGVALAVCALAGTPAGMTPDERYGSGPGSLLPAGPAATRGQLPALNLRRVAERVEAP